MASVRQSWHLITPVVASYHASHGVCPPVVAYDPSGGTSLHPSTLLPTPCSPAGLSLSTSRYRTRLSEYLNLVVTGIFTARALRGRLLHCPPLAGTSFFTARALRGGRLLPPYRASASAREGRTSSLPARGGAGFFTARQGRGRLLHCPPGAGIFSRLGRLYPLILI